MKPNSFQGFLFNNSSPRMVRVFLFSLAVLFPIQSLKVDLQVSKQLTQLRATCFVYIHVNKKGLDLSQASIL